MKQIGTNEGTLLGHSQFVSFEGHNLFAVHFLAHCGFKQSLGHTLSVLESTPSVLHHLLPEKPSLIFVVISYILRLLLDVWVSWCPIAGKANIHTLICTLGFHIRWKEIS